MKRRALNQHLAGGEGHPVTLCLALMVFLVALGSLGCAPTPIQPALPVTTPTRVPAAVPVTAGPTTSVSSTPAAPTRSAARERPAAVSSSPTPTDCPYLPVGNFNSLWQDTPGLRVALGCPASHHPRIAPIAWEIKTSFQSFEHGTVLWTNSQGWYAQPTVFVIHADSSFDQYEDRFDPSVDASGGTATPPSGLIEPSLGIGKVWRENPSVRNGLGWASALESPGAGRLEMYMNGDMVWASQLKKTFVLFWVPQRVQVFDFVFSEQ